MWAILAFGTFRSLVRLCAYMRKFHELSNVQAQRHIFVLQWALSTHTHTNQLCCCKRTCILINIPKSDKQKACDENVMHLPHRIVSTRVKWAHSISVFACGLICRWHSKMSWFKKLKRQMATRHRQIASSSHEQYRSNQPGKVIIEFIVGTKTKTENSFTKTNYDVVSIFILVGVPILSCVQYEMVRAYLLLSPGLRWCVDCCDLPNGKSMCLHWKFMWFRVTD